MRTVSVAEKLQIYTNFQCIRPIIILLYFCTYYSFKAKHNFTKHVKLFKASPTSFYDYTPLVKVAVYFTLQWEK